MCAGKNPEKKMNNRLNAETIRKSKSKLKKRFSDAYSVLTIEAKSLFDLNRDDLFDFENARIVSIGGKFCLQWVNDGQTNRGSVKLCEIQ